MTAAQFPSPRPAPCRRAPKEDHRTLPVTRSRGRAVLLQVLGIVIRRGSMAKHAPTAAFALIAGSAPSQMPALAALTTDPGRRP